MACDTVCHFNWRKWLRPKILTWNDTTWPGFWLQTTRTEQIFGLKSPILGCFWAFYPYFGPQICFQGLLLVINLPLSPNMIYKPSRTVFCLQRFTSLFEKFKLVGLALSCSKTLNLRMTQFPLKPEMTERAPFSGIPDSIGLRPPISKVRFSSVILTLETLCLCVGSFQTKS